MAGKRYSQQRDLIYRQVASSCEHPTADMVYRSLKEKAPSLSLGTVYRNLNLLCEEGQLIRLPFGITDRYDATITPHAHLECTGCGGVFDLAGDTSAVRSSYADSNPDCQLEMEMLVFRGICADCKKMRESAKTC